MVFNVILNEYLEGFDLLLVFWNAVFKKFYVFIYSLTVLNLHCFRFFSSCGEWGLLIVVCRLTAVASLLVKYVPQSTQASVLGGGRLSC